MSKILLGLIVILLGSCSKNDNVAGTASKTETGEMYGILVTQDKNPSIGATVVLIEVNDNQGLAKSSGHSAMDTILDTVVTNNLGQYRFKDVQFGRYSISAFIVRNQDTLTTYHGGIILDVASYNVGTDTLVAPGKIRTIVEIGSMSAPEVTCYIPGTSYSAITNDSGLCIISGIPPGIYEVAYMLNGYITTKTSSILVESNIITDLGHIVLQADPKGDPPIPLGIDITYDTVKGIVELTWNPVIVSDLGGYVIYRDDPTSTDPTRLNQNLVTAQIYSDTIKWMVDDSVSESYQYRIQSQDNDGNRSAYNRFNILIASPISRPTNPSPENRSQNVSLSTLLKWQSVSVNQGSSLIYQVYIDTVANPKKLVFNGLDTNQVIANNLIAGATYYWKVVAIIDSFKIESQSWRFTTKALTFKNQTPNEPAQPFPANGTKEVPYSSYHFSWVGGDPDSGDVVLYDVYMDTLSPPTKKIATRIMDTTLLQTEMRGGANYYWQVIATDTNQASVSGPIWSFTTETQPPTSMLTLLHPGNQVIDEGNTIVLTLKVDSLGTREISYKGINLPANAVLLGANFAWTPSVNQSGKYDIIFVVSDNNDTQVSDTAYVTITVRSKSRTMIVSGDINTNTTWNSDTVKITGDVYVSENSTLTILPGTYVEFQGYYKLDIKGCLKAIGLLNDSIVFTPKDTIDFSNRTSNIGAWNGIDLLNPVSSDSTIIDFCKFQYAKAGWDDQKGSHEDRGGVLYIMGKQNLRISNSIFKRNFSRDEGGAIYTYGSSPIIHNNDFSSNIAGSYGGAISANGGLVISNNTFDHNSVFDEGAGAVWVSAKDGEIAIVKNNRFTFNSGREWGGGLTSYDSRVDIDGNYFDGNIATNGGGMYLFNVTGEIKNNVLINNTSSKYGAGVYHQNLPTAHVFRNNIVCNNLGSGIHLEFEFASNPSFQNNTIYNNSVTGLQITGPSNFTLKNNIIWKNSSTSGYELKLDLVSEVKLIYNDIQKGIKGISNLTHYDSLNYKNNIELTPIFVDAQNNNFHEAISSPTIDAGDPSSDYSSEPQSNNPIINPRINLGAFGNSIYATLRE